MSWIKRVLHLDEPMVSDDERAELAHLTRVTAEASERAQGQAVEAHRLAQFFKGQKDQNHIAERLNIAIRGR